MIQDPVDLGHLHAQAENDAPPLDDPFKRLCQLETLHLVYANARDEFQACGMDATTSNAVEAEDPFIIMGR